MDAQREIVLPSAVFRQILNNSSFLRAGGHPHPLAQIVQSNQFQDVLIERYRGNNAVRRVFKCGPFMPRGNRMVTGQIRLLTELNARHYKTIENQLYFWWQALWS